MVRNVFEEALEDVALVHAVEEGKQSSLTSRDEVFKLLGRCGATTHSQPRRGGIVKLPGIPLARNTCWADRPVCCRPFGAF